MARLAPELDLRYESLYAYLNNDLGRKHLSVDLACRLLAGSLSTGALSQTQIRALLGPCARLVGLGVLEQAEAVPAGSSLQHGYTVAPVVVQSLLGMPLGDPRWPRDVRWIAARQDPRRAGGTTVERAGVLVLAGEDVGECRHRAQRVAQDQGWPLLEIASPALGRDGALGDRLRLAARLVGGALLVDAPADEGASAIASLARDCSRDGTPLIVVATAGVPIAEALANLPHARVFVPTPPAAERAAHWRQALERAGLPALPVDRLAEAFALGPSCIDAAVRSVALAAHPDDALARALEQEASTRSNETLACLATPVVRRQHWDQLVLAKSVVQQLREIAAAITSRDCVYRRWGMLERTGRGAGLMIFFTGASGTGKTMAASVVANAVGLELYRIDLASVVSKYIGETEKNLDRIFGAAKRSNAILLFDEADALLGKRSEVKDAHDRYANIEVAYLLQKMEDHDGVVILSCNLPKNLDPAFSRRMHFVSSSRGRTPRCASACGAACSRRRRRLPPTSTSVSSPSSFETTGGDIQAIALDAAFLAAAAGVPIGMAQLMRAMTRRQTKQGNPGGWARYQEHRDAFSASAEELAEGAR